MWSYSECHASMCYKNRKNKRGISSNHTILHIHLIMAHTSSSISTMHTSSSGSLQPISISHPQSSKRLATYFDTRSMCQAPLEPQYSTRDLVTESGVALMVVDRRSVAGARSSGTTETGHEGRACSAGSGGSGSSWVMHFDDGGL